MSHRTKKDILVGVAADVGMTVRLPRASDEKARPVWDGRRASWDGLDLYECSFELARWYLGTEKERAKPGEATPKAGDAACDALALLVLWSLDVRGFEPTEQDLALAARPSLGPPAGENVLAFARWVSIARHGGASESEQLAALGIVKTPPGASLVRSAYRLHERGLVGDPPELRPILLGDAAPMTASDTVCTFVVVLRDVALRSSFQGVLNPSRIIPTRWHVMGGLSRADGRTDCLEFGLGGAGRCDRQSIIIVHRTTVCSSKWNRCHGQIEPVHVHRQKHWDICPHRCLAPREIIPGWSGLWLRPPSATPRAGLCASAGSAS